MTRLPGLMFVVDSKKERSPSARRNKLGIPIVAIVDTNADPDLITVPIAGNDDAIRSVELITKAIADAIVEARREAPVREETEEGEGSTTYSSDRGAEPADEGETRASPSPAPSPREARSDRGAPQDGGEGRDAAEAAKPAPARPTASERLPE